MSRRVIVTCPTTVVVEGDESAKEGGPTVEFQISEVHAFASNTIKNVVEACDQEEGQEVIGPIPLPGINASTMQLVVDFLEHPDERAVGLSEADQRALPLSQWYIDFFTPLNAEQLVQLMCAGNFLDCKALLNASTKCLALRISKLDPKGIKEMFGFHGEFTPEQIAKAKADHEWLGDTI